MEMFKFIIAAIYWILLWAKFLFVASHDCPRLTALAAFELFAFVLIAGTAG